MTRFLFAAGLALIAVGAVTGQQAQTNQDPHAHMNHHPAAMGFDQYKTTHHFYLYENGGAIDVAVNDADDATNLEAIRTHLPEIAKLFGEGNFDAPMLVHGTNVPGTAAMTRLKERIKFAYSQTPKGGHVNILTTDPEALAAVHEFLRFQITDHKTGDTLHVTKR